VTEEHDATITDGRTPPAEVDVDEAVARRLLAAQHADLTDLPLAFVTHGWDNVTFRLGDELAVRLPRRAVAVELIANEQRWLPELAARVGVPVPEPVRAGQPDDHYPFPWSVVRWVDGTPTDVEPLGPEAASELGAFLAALHGPAPDDAPRNPYRGIPLRVKEPAVLPRLDRLEANGLVDVVVLDRARMAWAAAVDEPIDLADSWLHSDLHAKNVIGADGRLAGVIDWGDLGVGDPATDLAAAWMHFDADAHDAVWDAYGGITEATWARARAWAVFFGAVCLDSAGTEEVAFARMGRETLERI
jgi:aminoglycoside phosphotransferase (APT) family kinase protein